MTIPTALTEREWLSFAKEMKLKDDSLKRVPGRMRKALEALAAIKPGNYDELLGCISNIIAEIKMLEDQNTLHNCGRDLAIHISNKRSVFDRHLSDMGKAADKFQKDIIKEKRDAETARANAAKAAAKAAREEEDDDDEQSGGLAYGEKLLAMLKKLKSSTDAVWQFVVCVGKENLYVMVAKKITPSHKQQLSELAETKVFRYSGTCTVKGGKYVFIMDSPAPQLARRLQASIKLHTGKKIPIIIGDEYADDSDDDDPNAVTLRFGPYLEGLPTIKKDLKLGGFIVNFGIEPKFTISGKVSVKGVDAKRIEDKTLKQAALKVTAEWFRKECKPALLDKGGILENVKGPRWENGSFLVDTFAQTPLGKLSFSFTIFGLSPLKPETDFKFENFSIASPLTLLEAKVELEQTVIPLKTTMTLAGVAFSAELSITSGCAITLAPDFEKMFLEFIAKKIASGVASVAAGVGVAGSVVFLAGASIAIASVGTAIYQLAYATNLSNASGNFERDLANAQVGFKAGMSEGGAPSNAFGKIGYQLGKDNFNKLCARARQQNPNATDDAIRDAVKDMADRAWQDIKADMRLQISKALWEKFLDSNRTFVSRKDAWEMFQACGLQSVYRGDPRYDKKAAASPEWQAYLKQYP